MKREQAVQFVFLWAALLLLVVSVDFLLQERIYHYFRLDREARGLILVLLSQANDVLRFPISMLPGITYEDLTYGSRSARYYLVAASCAFLWAIPFYVVRWLARPRITRSAVFAMPLLVIAAVVYALLAILALFPFLPEQFTPSAYQNIDTILIAGSLLFCSTMLVRKARTAHRAG